MSLQQWLLILISSGLLCACVPAQQAIEPEEDVVKTVPTIATSELACAEVQTRFVGDARTVRYVSQNIYRSGAALPTVEGMACLDVLADWLRNKPQLAWKITIGGETQTGFDAQALVNKRQELLQRYFLRKGIDTEDWEWQNIPRHKVQLRLDELKGLP